MRQKPAVRLIRSLPGTWLRDKELVRSHHLSGLKDSGYTANSIAFRNHTLGVMEVNPGLFFMFRSKKIRLVRDWVSLRHGFHGILRGNDAAVNPK